MAKRGVDLVRKWFSQPSAYASRGSVRQGLCSAVSTYRLCRARSIPKCNIPQKEWMHGKPLHTSELRGTSNDPCLSGSTA